jgi:hypothetical protein
MFGEKYEEEVLKIPISDNTISRRILDFQSQVIANIKEAGFSAIKLDVSADTTGEAQLVAFSRFVCNGDITELPEITKGQEIDVVGSYFPPNVSPPCRGGGACATL